VDTVGEVDDIDETVPTDGENGAEFGLADRAGFGITCLEAREVDPESTG
jgi:hypothetical protein